MSQVLEQSPWEIEESDHLETSDYPFDEPDSPDNIQFAEPTDPEMPVGNHPPLIKGASLPKLVERVTYDEYPGIFNFFFTHHCAQVHFLKQTYQRPRLCC